LKRQVIVMSAALRLPWRSVLVAVEARQAARASSFATPRFVRPKAAQ
jgi:hypothetical protein